MRLWPFGKGKQKREQGSWPVRWLRAILRWSALVVVGWWVTCSLLLVLYRFVPPPTTAVHVERRVQAWLEHKPYRERYEFVPLRAISPTLQHAVIAAEDAKFYHEHGFDWQAMDQAAKWDLKGHRLRGGSTIDQQLVKNLFLGTNRSILRKVLEASLVPVAEVVLGKQRILTLYLNEVEWGRGVYGAEAASRYYYGKSARNLSRVEAAQLAAILPDPLHWAPQRMGWYSGVIERRMSQMGW
ncbi:MAG: monofunctional biosynthetic peptidoglycan transglycosylase [Acidobacteriaceae bacterium]